MGVTATNKITAYNQSVASVGRASAIATSATNLLSISLRGVAAAASFAWPIAAIMAATSVYNNLNDSLEDTKKNLDELADDQSWGQLADQIANINSQFNNENITGFFSTMMKGLNDLKLVFEANPADALWGLLTYGGSSDYQSTLKKQQKKLLDIKDKAELDLVTNYRKKFADVVDAKGAGAENLNVEISRQIKKLKASQEKLS